MVNEKREKPVAWWRRCEPFRFFLVSLPSIRDAGRRWVLFQVILSIVFFFVAIAIGLLTVDVSQVSGVIMVVALFLFTLGLVGLVYAIGIGLHWYSAKNTIIDNAESERAKRDDRLHEDIQSSIKSNQELVRSTHEAIQSLIQEIRQDRDERKRSIK